MLHITLLFNTYRAKILCFCPVLISTVCRAQPRWLHITQLTCSRTSHLVGPKNGLAIYFSPPDFTWCFLLNFVSSYCYGTMWSFPIVIGEVYLCVAVIFLIVPPVISETSYTFLFALPFWQGMPWDSRISQALLLQKGTRN